MTVFDTLKSDAKEAAYRVVGTQLLLTAKNGLLNVLRKRGINNKYVNTVSDFLETDIGSALLSTGVGVAVSYLPAFKKDTRAQTIAKEFRVAGIVVLGNLIVDRTVGDILPIIKNIIRVLPIPPKKIRIDTTSLTPNIPIELEEDITIDNHQQRKLKLMRKLP